MGNASEAVTFSHRLTFSSIYKILPKNHSFFLPAFVIFDCFSVHSFWHKYTTNVNAYCLFI